MSQNNQLGHLERFGPATRNSVKGLVAAYKNEIAFRQYTWLMLLLLPIAYVISVSVAEFAMLVLSILIVLIAELLNTAVEAVVDRIGLEHHELSGRAKDVGSAAVFVSLFGLVLVWGYKFITMLLPSL